MAQDPACGNQPNFDESYVVKDGKLANVFVYVKTAERVQPGPFVAVNATRPIEQRGCRYYPHVLGVITERK